MILRDFIRNRMSCPASFAVIAPARMPERFWPEPGREDRFVFRFIPTVIFVVFAVATLFASGGMYPRASATDSRPTLLAVEATPMFARAERSALGNRARTDAVIIGSALRYGIMPGCPIVGGFEDGTIYGYCIDTDTLIVRGGNPGDTWNVTHAPMLPRWQARADYYDGQSGTALSPATDSILAANLVAGTYPVVASGAEWGE